MLKEKKTMLITGGSGLLGLNWALLKHESWNVVFAVNSRFVCLNGIHSIKLDLSNRDLIRRLIDDFKIDLVVHTAGLTSIELCEANPRLAREVNTIFSGNVAHACKACEIPMIHVSTDNLFDGKDQLVLEDHPINPLNIYGKTKADAESLVQELHSDIIIARTNFYGWGPPYKHSFSDAILIALRAGREITLFSDVYYTPIVMSELVQTSHDLLDNDLRGVFHVCGNERLTKLSFGKLLAQKFSLDVSLIKSGDLASMKNLAMRPFDMSMSNSKTVRELGKNLGSVVDQIEKLQKLEKSNIKRKLDGIDTLR